MNRRDDWTPHWTAVALMLLALGAFFVWAPKPPKAPASPPASARGVKWFFMARMPPITRQHESGVDTMKRRYGEWFTALRRAGFRPMRLSEVRARLARGEGLPPRTLVTVFEPGWRRTYEELGPVFAAQGWPGLWLTDGPAMERGHREFITYKTARDMVASGWWDVGFSREDGGYTLDGFTLGPWSPVDGTFAFNSGADMSGLCVLNVNGDWTASELVTRLLAEVPARGPTPLAKSLIDEREWGVTGGEPFDLGTTLLRGGNRVYWLGTKAAPDFRLQLDVASFIGELRLHLRSDSGMGDGIDLVFSDKSVVIEEYALNSRRRLWTALRSGRGVKADVLLEGRRLRFTSDAGSWSTDELQVTGRSEGLVELSVAEKVRGAARADSVKLVFTPLTR